MPTKPPKETLETLRAALEEVRAMRAEIREAYRLRPERPPLRAVEGSGEEAEHDG